jgi:hypothetical protein
MTLAERVRSVIEVASEFRSWLMLVGAVGLVLLLARACSGERAAEAEVRRLKEASELERAGFLVAQRASQAELEEQAKKIPALQTEIERLEKALKAKPRIITVERIRTEPAPAEGTPRPLPEPGAPCPDCLFARGDTGDIRIDSVHLETREGNQVAAVAAECWRLTPAPETRILAGVGSAPVSSLLVETPAEEPGWGLGLLAGYGTSGAVGTVQGITPPLLWRLSLTAALTAGRDEVQLQGGIVYR